MYLNGKSIAGAAEAVAEGLLVDITDEVQSVDVQITDRVFVSRRLHDDLLAGEDYMLSRAERVRDIAHPLRMIHLSGLHTDEASYLVGMVVVRRDGSYETIRLRQVLLKGDGTLVAVLMPAESLTLGPEPINVPEAIWDAQSEHIEDDRAKFVRLFDLKPVDIPAGRRLAGADEYSRAEDEALLGEGPDWAVGDHKHYAFNHSFLEVGLPAIVAETAANARKTNGVESQYLAAIRDAYTAIIGFIQRHADAAAELASHADGSDIAGGIGRPCGSSGASPTAD